jgi:hypothetical protein
MKGEGGRRWHTLAGMRGLAPSPGGWDTVALNESIPQESAHAVAKPVCP